MKKPVRKHVSAVRHAKQLLKTAAHRLPDGQTRTDLLEDVKLLTEVATMVHYQIVNPTLPFAVPDDHGTFVLQAEVKNPMFNKLADTACEVG